MEGRKGRHRASRGAATRRGVRYWALFALVAVPVAEGPQLHRTAKRPRPLSTAVSTPAAFRDGTHVRLDAVL
jgi:hypothetical protein